MSNCAVHGPDPIKLANSSPLTCANDIDVIEPAYLYYYPDEQNFLLARTGSTSLGNVEYCRSEVTRQVFERPDIQKLMQHAGVPIHQTQTLYKIDPLGFRKLAVQKILNAFRQLVAMNAKAVVCEGASHFFPSWKDCSVANHVFFTSTGKVYFYPHMNFSPAKEPRSQLSRLREFREAASDSQETYSVPFSIAPQPYREKLTDQLVGDLLRRAKLID